MIRSHPRDLLDWQAAQFDRDIAAIAEAQVALAERKFQHYWDRATDCFICKQKVFEWAAKLAQARVFTDRVGNAPKRAAVPVREYPPRIGPHVRSRTGRVPTRY